MGALTVLPDATSIKTRFPELASASDAAIAFAVQEAALLVDDSWMASDRIPAVSFLAAHYMAIAGASAGVDGREVVSETIGPISVTYAQVASAASSAAAGNFDGTAYGKRFKALLRRNHGHPMTIT